MPVDGNMSGAYFVGKVPLLKWLQEFLNEDITKVEDCSSGHHYLMCLDALYPGQVNFVKAKYNAQLEWEKIENLKIVQQVLTNNNVERVVDVGKLAKGKLQDNLEFLQWFKWWFDQSYDYTQPFSPAASKAKFGKKTTAIDQPIQQKLAQKQHVEDNTVYRQPPPAHNYGQGAHAAANRFVQPAPIKRNLSDVHGQQEGIRNQELQELREKAAELQKLADKRTKESKFYFNKLRQIELYCGELRDLFKELGREEKKEGDAYDAVAVCDRVEEILYAPYKESE